MPRLHNITLDSDAVNLPVTFDVDSFHVMDEMGARTESEAMASQARQVWDHLDDTRRAALVSLVGEALREMAGSVDEWLEGALVAKRDEKIGIFVLFKLGNLDDQILRLKAQADAERLSRIADLRRLTGALPTPS